jgi:hypothetical protein
MHVKLALEKGWRAFVDKEGRFVEFKRLQMVLTGHPIRIVVVPVSMHDLFLD